MNMFKPAVFLMAIALVIASCGPQDKTKELNDLKAKRADLDAKITALEKELNLNPNEVKMKKVIFTDVATSAYQHYIEMQGLVDAENNVVVAPQIPGLLTKIYVNEGDVVSAGQLLAETDNSAYSAQIAAIQPQLEMAVDVYNRQKRLWDQKIGSEVQLLQAETQKNALQKQINAIQAQIELTKVKAPISGVIDHMGARLGQFASAQNPDPCFRIVNLASLKVKAEVAESYASKIKKGDKVSLYFPDINQTVDANVTFTAKFISPLTRTFTVEAKVPGSNDFLRPNMVSVVKVVDYVNPNAVVVPINLIQNESNSQYVYVGVYEGSNWVARRRMITVGSVYGGSAEVLGGLNVGDKLITTGASELTEGMAVEI